MTFHGSDIAYYSERPYLSRILTSWVVARAEKVSAVSRSLADRASIVFPKLSDIEVIYNGLDFTELQASDQATKTGGAIVDLPASFILMVSNVTYNKGQDLAVRAWGEIRETLPDLHLVIVGEPRDLWQECKDLIRVRNRATQIAPTPAARGSTCEWVDVRVLARKQPVQATSRYTSPSRKRGI